MRGARRTVAPTGATRRAMSLAALLGMAATLQPWWGAVPALAAETTLSGASCDWSHLAALAMNGGTVVVQCSGAIAFHSAIPIAGGVSTTIEAALGWSPIFDGGGTVALFSVSDGGSLSLQGLTLQDGSSATDGGAIDNEGGALTISNSTLMNNTAGGSGGGSGGAIYAHLGQTSVSGSTFYDNSVSGTTYAFGGAIDAAGGTLTVVNSTLAGNAAAATGSGTAEGGGVYAGAGSVTLINDTLSGNIAPDGANVYGAAAVSLENTLLSAPAGGGGNCGGSVSDGGHNLEAGDETCGSSIPEAADVHLGALAANGGPTETMAVLTDSPAIGQGDAAVCADPNSVAEVDQRGAPRAAGSCDIGAYAYTVAPPAITTLTPGAGGAADVLTVSGTGFGATPGAVGFTQGTADYTQAGAAATWSQTEAQAAVPAGLSAGSVSVAVYDAITGLVSPAASFSVASADGSGILTASPVGVTAGSSGNTLTFDYVASTGGLAGGTVTITLPAGWSPPTTSGGAGDTSASAGTLSTSGQTITVSSLTLAGGDDLRITYGGASAPAAPGPSVLHATMASLPADTAATLAAPTVQLNAALAVTTLSLPGAVVGQPYADSLLSSGGALPYQWSVMSGALPPGLTLSASGVISGTPTSPTSGTARFVPGVTDASSPQQSATGAALTITVAPPLAAAAAAALPPAIVGVHYSAGLAATHGTAPYRWSVSAGALPQGLSLSPSGTVSGTPSGPAGTSDFTAAVTDGSSPQQSAETALSLSVAAVLGISTSSLPDAVVSGAYATTLAAVGGTAPYSWSVTGGSLPDGLALSSDGKLSGVPTEGAAGTSTFTVTVDDGESPPQSAQASLTLRVSPQLAITTSRVPGAVVGHSYETALSASGGNPPYTWALASGSLPDGLSLQADGAISGTAAADAASSTFTAAAADASNPHLSAGQTLTITVTPALSVDSGSLASGMVFQPYSEMLASSGGTPPVTWSVASGTLPPGLTLDPNGTLHGSPNAAGTFTFTAEAGDASSPAQSASGQIAVVIAPLTLQVRADPVVAASTGGGASVATPDGAFSMSLPVGALPAGETLTATDSCGADAASTLLQVASCTFTLAGAALRAPAVATVRYNVPVPAGGIPISADRLSLFTQGPGGQWVFLPSTVDPATGTVRAHVGGPGVYVVMADTRTFSDVPVGAPAAAAIDRLVAAGIINGFPNGTFRPNAALTRAQFVKMLVLALGLQPSGSDPAFRDASTGWYAPYVAAAVRAGLVAGLSPSRFGPNAHVTRQQMAVLVARALHLPGGSPPAFSDGAHIAAWAAPAVGASVAGGYVAGFPDGSFRPTAAATRGEAALALAQVIAHLAP